MKVILEINKIQSNNELYNLTVKDAYGTLAADDVDTSINLGRTHKYGISSCLGLGKAFKSTLLISAF